MPNTGSILPQPSPGKIPAPNRNKSEYSVPLNVQMYPAEEEKKTREEEALIEMKPIFPFLPSTQSRMSHA